MELARSQKAEDDADGTGEDEVEGFGGVRMKGRHGPHEKGKEDHWDDEEAAPGQPARHDLTIDEERDDDHDPGDGLECAHGRALGGTPLRHRGAPAVPSLGSTSDGAT